MQECRDDARSFPRLECLAPVRVRYASGRVQYARMMDYGEGGFRLVSRSAFDEDAVLDLVFEGFVPENSALTLWETYRGVVRWTRKVEGPGLPLYEAGIQRLPND
jgi:hypothetical protein